ncbi:MAG TPA: hypothetical protein PLL09_04035 [Flavobacterium sp.]|uniref:hypothetical protein n=1 Tax=unclassified Flavobacterium TaxID=196869 RepID=UPI000E8C29CC|nr:MULTISPECIES: hypothetical protein [unclassified Flavobacterium]HBI01336.1 hypothetical protein [Flavobacterium sp.]HRE76976.1 hypothetical protein [Flavobacterium sp.]
MKNLKSLFVASIVAATFVSCADEKKTQAEKAVNNYTAYIDSVSNVASEDLAEKWDDVESAYVAKKIEAESALENLEDRAELDRKVEESSAKYEAFKANLVAERQKMEAANYKAKVRSSLFGGQQINDDMNFDWVNKDNILQTYETFVNTASDNKDNYSREEWDEIKLLYEALDTRKNTVEKEGLSGSDNLKIAGLKTRFATFFKVNRIGAKSEENAEAKE